MPKNSRPRAAARSAKPKAPAPTRAPSTDDLEHADVTGLDNVIHDLIGKLNAHQVTPETRAYYHALIDADVARIDGESIATPPIILDVGADFGRMIAALKQRPLPGYGPLRARYTLEMARDHIEVYRKVLLAGDVRAGAAGTKSVTLASAKKARRALEKLMNTALTPDAPERVQLDRAKAKLNKLLPDVLAAIESLVSAGNALFERAGKDPGLAAALVDMNVTPERFAALGGQSVGLTQAGQLHAEQRGAHQELYGKLNELDGRMVFELEALECAANLARGEGRSVPMPMLENIRRVRPRRHDQPATPPPPTTPVAPGGASGGA
jgi:hypothetical protein